MQPGDADPVAALIRTAFGTIREPLDPAPSALQETGPSVLAQLAQGGGAVVDQAGIVACVLWLEKDRGLYVARFAVASHCRNQGLAARLVHAAEAEARRRGLPRLHLGVRLVLPGNRRLFARLGFAETTLHAHEGYAQPTWTAAEKWLVTAPPPGTGRPPGSPDAPHPAAPSSARSQGSGR